VPDDLRGRLAAVCGLEDGLYPVRARVEAERLLERLGLAVQEGRVVRLAQNEEPAELEEGGEDCDGCEGGGFSEWRRALGSLGSRQPRGQGSLVLEKKTQR